MGYADEDIMTDFTPVTVAVSWDTVGRLNARKASSWELRSSVVAEKTAEWRVTDKVSNAAASSWNVSYRIIKQKPVRFNDLLEVPTFSDTRFNTLFRTVVRDWHLVPDSPGNIDTAVVHPISYTGPAGRRLLNYGLDRPVVYPLDNQDYPGYGQVPEPGIAWRTGLDPDGRVVCQQDCEFNDLTDARCQERTEWNTIQRFARDETCLFNSLNQVTVSTIIEWNIGQGIASHIRQTAQIRQDFAY